MSTSISTRWLVFSYLSFLMILIFLLHLIFHIFFLFFVFFFPSQTHLFLFFSIIFLIFPSCPILFRFSFDFSKSVFSDICFCSFVSRFFPEGFKKKKNVRLFLIRTSIYLFRTLLFFNLLLLLESQKKHTQRLVEPACYCRASSTAQQSAEQSAMHKAWKHVRTCRSECDNASKQTELARASISSRSYLQFAVFSKINEEIEVCPLKNVYTTTLSWWCAKGLPFFVSNLDTIQHSDEYVVFRTCLRDACTARPGCFPGAWSSWQLQVVSLHLFLDLCPRQHIVLFQYFLVGERSGRKPPARSEAPCKLVPLQIKKITRRKSQKHPRLHPTLNRNTW